MRSERKPFRLFQPAGPARRLAVIALGMAAALTAGGCVATGFGEGPTLPKAPLPDYPVGISFSYDDGLTETVMAQDGEVLTWRTGTGVVRSRYRNFLVPHLSWQNSTQRSNSETDAAPIMLWPLEIGNNQRFTLKQIVENNDGTERREFSQNWQCKVDGTETVTVPAGTFDTYRIPCFRYYRQFWRQTQTYFYAPKVGYYVLLKDDSRSQPSRRRKLVSYGLDSAVLPVADRRARQRAIQQALENSKDGVGVPWRSLDGLAAGMVTPIRPLAVEGENNCRVYTRAVTAFGHTRTVEGKACRKENGIWWEVN